jgi:hypothetical protein
VLYKKNTYILELLLNKVTAGTKALTELGNKLSYACDKEVCKEAFDTIHQLSLLKLCDPNQYFRQVHMYIHLERDQGCKAIQLPVEMLQQLHG